MATTRKTKSAGRRAGLELRGKGIYLRPAALTDAAGLYRHINDEAVAHYTVNIPHPYPRTGMTEFLKTSLKAMKAGRRHLFTIRRYDDDEPIGAIDLTLSRSLPCAELGYWLARKYWGQGIMTQAVKLVLPFAFDTLKLHRLTVSHLAGNHPSRRVIEKCWFRREGADRELVCKNGKWLDAIRYGLLDHEYRRINTRAQLLIPAPAKPAEPGPVVHAPKPKPPRKKVRK